ncbi:hypothetical protein GNI_036350 [Gregarina niphandrodes]|uniref:Transcription factor TFIIIB component B'' Myb domain-containing protein n=1 Tax=Gregarina niphandrodes TaxID=110365 RepID=A0A023BAP0_GRENI|nr:hypothetical protein GNI_036350 [Gregarina niphandrodes]EZG78434.1 hypothetical protein GNI_036350 [Gregarina niphandrodes]|eukprot:XP_011129308.1 hypothetical protein GNI_036350 [Gregarina niphandrodes]
MAGENSPPASLSLGASSADGALLDEEDELLISVRKRPRREKYALVKRTKPRWEDEQIPDGDLTMWEICMRNKRQVTAEEKEAKRKNKEAARLAEEKAAQERLQMMTELGAEAGASDVLDLFTGGTVETVARPEPIVTAPEETDLFAVGANDFDVGGGDLFSTANDRSDIYELTTYEASNRGLTPFKGAYKNTKATKWSGENTNEFYKWVSMFGNDTVMIQAHMPQFTTKQISQKITRELKNNPKVFALFVAAKKKISLETYEAAHGTLDRSGGISFERRMLTVGADEPQSFSMDDLFG